MPDPSILPKELEPITKLQAPELTALNRKELISDLFAHIAPYRQLQRKRSSMLFLGAAAAALLSVGLVQYWYVLRPGIDELWLGAVSRLEFGASTQRYFNRTYGDMSFPDEYRLPARPDPDIKWDSISAVRFLRSGWGDSACLLPNDQVTFLFEKDQLVRVSFRFCGEPRPCHVPLFDLFQALSSFGSHGDQRYFEIKGAEVNILGWSDSGFTVLDLVAKSALPLSKDSWINALHGNVQRNQCGPQSTGWLKPVSKASLS
jgi:hypothetical protein